MDGPRFTLRKRTAAILAALLLAGALATATVILSLRVTLSAPPAPTILSGPTNPTSSTSASFIFSDEIDGVSFQCSLDSAGYSACTSGKTYSGLTTGSHTFRVTAKNGSSPTSRPASYSWVVDTGTGEGHLGFPASTNGPPSAEIRFPTNNGQYQLANWAAGCVPASAGLCGTATAISAVAAVRVSILQQATGLYWNGSSFSAASETLNSATLQAPGHGSTAWTYALSLPPNGTYSAHVVATDSVGKSSSPGSDARVTFHAGPPLPPPPPVITSAPRNPTSATDAEIEFRDSQPGVTFLCSLDGGTFATCPDSEHDGDADYSNFAPGTHTFQVEAVDPAGDVSAPATYTWTVVVSGSFPIAGNITGLFAPGVTQPLDLSFTNPFGFDLKILSVTITVQHGTTKGGQPNPGCDGPTNMVVIQGFTGPVTVPGHATRSLQAFGVPQAQWPQVQMPDLSTNQDACKGTTFTFSYSGTATKG